MSEKGEYAASVTERLQGTDFRAIGEAVATEVRSRENPAAKIDKVVDGIVNITNEIESLRDHLTVKHDELKKELSEMRSVFNAKYESLRSSVSGIEKAIANVSTRDELTTRFGAAREEMTTRFDGMERRFDSVSDRFDSLEHQISVLFETKYAR